MENTRDWSQTRNMWVSLLEKKTGVGVDGWMRRIKKEGLNDEKSLRAWLTEQGVTGYAQSVLIMERFGYPDFFVASADQLIEGQYADRPHLRPIFDAVIGAARLLGAVVQARKTYVSLLTPRRTFARVQPTTKNRVDLGLRLEGQAPGGRLSPSRMHETMRLQISFTAPEEIDSEALAYLQRAFDENS